MDHPDLILWNAVEFNEVELIQKAIEQGADVNVKSEKMQQTPLMRLVMGINDNMQDRIKCVALLLNNHADPNLQDKEGKTVLHYIALRPKYLDIAKIVIMHGGDPTIEDDKHKSAFDVASPFKQYTQRLKELYASFQQKELDDIVGQKADPDINIL